MSTNVCYSNVNFVKIATRKAVYFLWTQVKLHFRLHRQTVWHSASKERFGEIFILLHAS